MLSESARMSSAAEARFRVPVPASVSRLVRVLALDAGCDDLLARLSKGSWTGVTFHSSAVASPPRTPLIDDLATGDMVVMITSAGADASAAARIGTACSDQRVHTATLILGASRADDETLSKTLAQVRPWSLMVVVVGDDGYVEDILRSFR